MSYSKEKMQVVFDGMVMFASPIIASFKIDAFKLLSKKNLEMTKDECEEILQELEKSVEFSDFVNHYGKAAGQLLLKTAMDFNEKFNANEDESQYGLEQYINFKANGFSLDEQLPILEHWLTTQSNHFISHLQEYPEILSFIRNNNDFETEAILSMLETYRISYQSFAEYCAFIGNAEQSRHFLESDQHTLAGMVGMLAFLERKKVLDIYRREDFTLNSDLTKEKEAERQQKKENGAEEALSIATSFWRERIANKIVNSQSEEKEVHEYNRMALELAILEGKESFEVGVPGQEAKETRLVSSLIGLNTADMTALQRLKTADEEMLNEAALKTAILEGSKTVEVIIYGKKQKQRVSSIIGFDTANMGTSGRAKTAGQIEALRVETHKMNTAQDEQEKEQSAQQILDFLVSIKQAEIEESPVNGKSPREQIARRNQMALEASILGKKGKISFNMVVSGKRWKKKVKVTDVIGLEQNPSKMTPSERLNVVNNIEQRKNAYASLKVGNVIAAIDKRMKALDERITAFKNVGAKTDKAEHQYNALYEARIILNGGPGDMAPRINSKGFSEVVQVFTEDSPTPTKRLELFEEHCKKHKGLFSDSASTQLLGFIGIIKNFFIKKIKKPENLEHQCIKRTISSPQLTLASQSPVQSTRQRSSTTTSSNITPKMANFPSSFLHQPAAPAQQRVEDSKEDSNKIEPVTKSVDMAAAPQRITPTPLSGG